MSHDYDSTLAFLQENYPPRAITLKLYVQTAWMGSYSVPEVLSSPELASELPPELLKRFLQSGNAKGVKAETLAWLAEMVEDSEEE